MTRDEFLKYSKEMFDDCYTIMEKKNHDYSQEGNPFSNFELQGFVSGVIPERTFLMALGTKMARLRELVGREDKAKVDESLDDTIKDMINYAALLSGYIKSKK